MGGAILIVCFVIGIIFAILYRYIDYDALGVISCVALMIGILFLVAIPFSIIQSKVNVERAIVFQETIDNSRKQEGALDVFERKDLIDKIMLHNNRITSWRVTGEKWWMNKWFYHPKTKEVPYIK